MGGADPLLSLSSFTHFLDMAGGAPHQGLPVSLRVKAKVLTVSYKILHDHTGLHARHSPASEPFALAVPYLACCSLHLDHSSQISTWLAPSLPSDS